MYANLGAGREIELELAPESGGDLLYPESFVRDQGIGRSNLYSFAQNDPIAAVDANAIERIKSYDALVVGKRQQAKTPISDEASTCACAAPTTAFSIANECTLGDMRMKTIRDKTCAQEYGPGFQDLPLNLPCAAEVWCVRCK